MMGTLFLVPSAGSSFQVIHLSTDQSISGQIKAANVRTLAIFFLIVHLSTIVGSRPVVFLASSSLLRVRVRLRGLCSSSSSPASFAQIHQIRLALLAMCISVNFIAFTDGYCFKTKVKSKCGVNLDSVFSATNQLNSSSRLFLFESLQESGVRHKDP